MLQGKYGLSCAVDGGLVAIGARDMGDGFVFAYQRAGTSWMRTATVAPSAGRDFGEDLSLQGELLLVGTPRYDGAFASQGAVHVLELAERYPSFCDGADGSHASCPCANPGSPEAGCDLAQGTGGVGLRVASQRTAPRNRITWSAAGFPPAGAPAGIVIRATQLDLASPVAFGDGLRCVGTPLVRLGAALASGGASTHVHGHGAAAGSYVYQLWFRNTPGAYCTPDAFNLSNGRTVAW